MLERWMDRLTEHDRNTLPGLKNILFFYTGTIGDTLLALPVMECLRNRFPDARFDLLNSALLNHCVHRELFDNLKLFDRMNFFVSTGNVFRKNRTRLEVLRWIQSGHYDAVFYSGYLGRPVEVAAFRLLGIRHVYNLMPSFATLYTPLTGYQLGALETLGVAGAGDYFRPTDLKFTSDEIKSVESYLASLKIPNGHSFVAIGLGGKTQVNHWPTEHFAEVLRNICPKHSLFPIITGGENERAKAERLIAECRTGAFPLGRITFRETVLMMKYCRFYLGMDTGTMHMAGVMNTPCVAIFSSRDNNTVFHPFGEDNIILRNQMPCEACHLSTCRYGSPARCVAMHTPASVIEAADRMMARLARNNHQEP